MILFAKQIKVTVKKNNKSLLKMHDCHFFSLFITGQTGIAGEVCLPGLCKTKNYHVNFPNPYEKTPSLVMVSLNGLDVDKDHDLRVTIHVTSKTPTSFNIAYRTWGDTFIK